MTRRVSFKLSNGITERQGNEMDYFLKAKTQLPNVEQKEPYGKNKAI
jgi:hypothetical protein